MSWRQAGVFGRSLRQPLRKEQHVLRKQAKIKIATPWSCSRPHILRQQGRKEDAGNRSRRCMDAGESKRQATQRRFMAESVHVLELHFSTSILNRGPLVVFENGCPPFFAGSGNVDM
jgi:hypothetical protein